VELEAAEAINLSNSFVVLEEDGEGLKVISNKVLLLKKIKHSILSNRIIQF